MISFSLLSALSILFLLCLLLLGPTNAMLTTVDLIGLSGTVLKELKMDNNQIGLTLI